MAGLKSGVLRKYVSAYMFKYYELFMCDVEGAATPVPLEHYRDGTKVDVWSFNQCRLLVEPLAVPFKYTENGLHLDFNKTAFGATVVSRRVANLLQQIAPDDFQRIPAEIDEKIGDWEVVNILSCVDCIDTKASQVRYFPEYHPKAGQINWVLPLILDSTRIGKHKIFHPRGWHVAVIVSEEVKRALESVGATGLVYVPVTR